MKTIRSRKNSEKQIKLTVLLLLVSLASEITGLVLGIETRIITAGLIFLFPLLLFYMFADKRGFPKKKYRPEFKNDFSIFLAPVEFRQRTAHQIKQAKRYSQEFSIICIGIRGLDSHFHERKTNILKGVEYSLNSILRESDFMTHDSSGMIYACLPMTNEKHDLSTVAEKIIHSINSYFYIASFKTNIKSNIGISRYPHNSTEPEKLMRAAEKAMEESVSMGGNTFNFHP